MDTLISLTDDSAQPSDLNNGIINNKIIEVGSYIDSYLTSRYPVPVTDANDLLKIKPICISLVVCDLYQRRLGLDYSDSLVSRRKLAIADLEKIQKGIIKLGSGSAETRPSVHKVSDRTRFFTEESMSTF
jgi:phage gp36-like protein